MSGITAVLIATGWLLWFLIGFVVAKSTWERMMRDIIAELYRTEDLPTANRVVRMIAEVIRRRQ